MVGPLNYVMANFNDVLVDDHLSDYHHLDSVVHGKRDFYCSLRKRDSEDCLAGSDSTS